MTTKCCMTKPHIARNEILSLFLPFKSGATSVESCFRDNYTYITFYVSLTSCFCDIYNFFTRKVGCSNKRTGTYVSCEILSHVHTLAVCCCEILSHMYTLAACCCEILSHKHTLAVCCCEIVSHMH